MCVGPLPSRRFQIVWSHTVFGWTRIPFPGKVIMMSRANRKREPEQWPRLVNLGLGVLLAGVVAYQLFAPSFQAPRTGANPGTGAPGSPLTGLLPGAGGPALPGGQHDPFTPLPPGSQVASGQPGNPAGTEGLPEPTIGEATGGRGRRSGGSETVWIPPSLESLPPVTGSPGVPIPEAASPPPSTTGANGDVAGQDSGEEMVMLPTRLLEARGGRNRTARFQYGGETLTRRQGDYLGTYRVERVDTDAIILIDSKKRRVRLLTGESVNGAPSTSSPSATLTSTPPAPATPIQTITPRPQRVANGAPTTPSVAPQPATPRPRPTPPSGAEKPVSLGGPLPTVKGNSREPGTPAGTHPEAGPANPPGGSPAAPTAPSVPAETPKTVRTAAPVAPAEGPLPLTRK